MYFPSTVRFNREALAKCLVLLSVSVAVFMALPTVLTTGTVHAQGCGTCTQGPGQCQHGGTGEIVLVCPRCTNTLDSSCCNDPGYTQDSSGTCTGASYQCSYYDIPDEIFVDNYWLCSNRDPA